MDSLPQSDTAPGIAESVFVVFVLVLSTGAFMNLSVAFGQDASDPSGMLGMQILWFAIYILTSILFLRHCERPLRSFLLVAPLVGLCALALASSLWSQDPQLTFRRAFALLITVLLGIYFGTRFRLEEQLRLLAWTCGICIIFSFIFGIFRLGTAVDAAADVPGWYGVFVQKNELGRMMVLSVLVFLYWKRTDPEHKAIANIGFLAAVVLILLSKSMTSLLVLAVSLIFLRYVPWVLGKGISRAIPGLLVLCATGVIGMLWMAAHLVGIADFLGRNVTLTGRLTIWIFSTIMALRRPWLGYGYNAFWLSSQSTTQRIWHALHWEAPHAHNGLLELWLELGILGVALFLLIFGYYSARSLAFLRQHRGAGASAWPLMFLIFMFLSNLTESSLLSRNSIFFILYAASALAVHVRPEEEIVLGEAAGVGHTFGKTCPYEGRPT